MKPFAQTALFFLLLLAGGCAATRERPKNPVSWNAHRSALTAKYSKDDSWYQDYETAVKDTAHPDLAQTLRNQVPFDLVWLVDDRYDSFENSLNASSASLDTATTVASLGATTASPITKAIGTKNILAGVSTIITGTDSAFNSNFFQSKARTAIIAAMRSGRVEVLTKITTGATQPIDKYPLAEGLSDVLAYFNAGTIVSAVNNIGDNAKQQKNDAKQKAKDAFGIK